MPRNNNISQAGEEDVPALVTLVNSAYRGESSKKGWTTEADLLDGLRTDQKAMEQLFRKPRSVILKYTDQDNQLLGCVNLQKQDEKLYLGMLTVSPTRQGGGIGKELLSASETYALKNNFSSIVMTVISLREELISWYERHGYRRTGQKKPFPTGDPSFGIPRQPLEFIVLSKEIHYPNHSAR